MKNLLKLELRKLSRQKSMYICLSIMAVLILLGAVVYKIVRDSGIDLGEVAVQMQIQNLSGIFFTLTTLSNANFFIIMGIVVSIIYCYDFEEQTVKNIFVKGYSRRDLFFSKVISILCATLFMFVSCFALSFVVGTIFFGVGEGSILSMLGLIGVQLLVSFAYSLFFTMICTLFKKFALSITMNIVIPMVMTLITTLIDSIIKSANFKIIDYWLDGMAINLISLSASTVAILIGIIASIVYMAIFVLVGALSSKKVET